MDLLIEGSSNSLAEVESSANLQIIPSGAVIIEFNQEGGYLEVPSNLDMASILKESTLTLIRDEVYNTANKSYNDCLQGSSGGTAPTYRSDGVAYNPSKATVNTTFFSETHLKNVMLTETRGALFEFCIFADTFLSPDVQFRAGLSAGYLSSLFTNPAGYFVRIIGNQVYLDVASNPGSCILLPLEIQPMVCYTFRMIIFKGQVYVFYFVDGDFVFLGGVNTLKLPYTNYFDPFFKSAAPTFDYQVLTRTPVITPHTMLVKRMALGRLNSEPSETQDNRSGNRVIGAYNMPNSTPASIVQSGIPYPVGVALSDSVTSIGGNGFSVCGNFSLNGLTANQDAGVAGVYAQTNWRGTLMQIRGVTISCAIATTGTSACVLQWALAINSMSATLSTAATTTTSPFVIIPLPIHHRIVSSQAAGTLVPSTGTTIVFNNPISVYSASNIGVVFKKIGANSTHVIDVNVTIDYTWDV